MLKDEYMAFYQSLKIEIFLEAFRSLLYWTCTCGGSPGWGPSSGVRVRSRKLTPFNPVTWTYQLKSLRSLNPWSLRHQCSSLGTKKICPPLGIHLTSSDVRTLEVWVEEDIEVERSFLRIKTFVYLYCFNNYWRKTPLKNLPCWGCTLLCSDATLFPSVWYGRRCGIDAANIFEIRWMSNYIFAMKYTIAKYESTCHMENV